MMSKDGMTSRLRDRNILRLNTRFLCFAALISIFCILLSSRACSFQNWKEALNLSKLRISKTFFSLVIVFNTLKLISTSWFLIKDAMRNKPVLYIAFLWRIVKPSRYVYFVKTLNRACLWVFYTATESFINFKALRMRLSLYLTFESSVSLFQSMVDSLLLTNPLSPLLSLIAFSIPT